MVMAMSAVKAAENTTKRGCFIAINAAMRKVLSPISEKMIIVRERTKECNGWMIEAGAEVSMGIDGVKGFRIASGSLLATVGGTGRGISCGFSGRSAGFCNWTISKWYLHYYTRLEYSYLKPSKFLWLLLLFRLRLFALLCIFFRISVSYGLLFAMR